MRYPLPAVLVTFIAMMTAMPANACRNRAPQDLGYLENADLVVVGTIANYEIRPGRLRADAPRSRGLEPQAPFHTDYARFEVRVSETLFGVTHPTFIAVWDNSTFGEPDTLPHGPYLLAFRRTAAAPGGQSGERVLLQKPCTSAFIFEPGSEQASEVRERVAALTAGSYR